MTDAVLSIAVSDIRSVCEGEPDVIERLKKAMRKAQDFWLSTDDDLRLRAACGAAMVTGSEQDKDRILRSLGPIRAWAASMAGVPVDMEAAIVAAGDDVIPLMKMWREAKEQRR